MNCLPDNFCVAPFLQLTAHPSGSFSPCPYLGGTVWQQQYQTIESQWRSPDLEALRQDFVDNKKNPICHRCWNEEANGKRSLRQRLYNPKDKTSDYEVINQGSMIEDLIQGLPDRHYLEEIKILTIKNGNLCNAKCRICHPGDSSRWAIEDSNKLHKATNRLFYPINSKEKNWTDQQVEEIFGLTKNLSRLELFGGEPFYNKKVLALLEKIVASGRSKNINLYINTNGSVDFTKLTDCLAHFRAVEIGVSIDDIGSRFAYQRHGLIYDEVISNIKTWQKFFDGRGTKYFIDSITTVNVFNVWHLPEIKTAVENLLPQPPYWNLLIKPDWLYIKNMPEDLKIEVINKLQTDMEQFENIVNVINQPADSTAWQQFKQITTSLDDIRKENVQDTFPELAKYI